MTSKLLLVAPAVPIAIGLCMLLVRERRLLHVLDVAGSLATLGFGLAIAHRVASSGPFSALGVFRADALTIVFLLLIGLLSVAASVASI